MEQRLDRPNGRVTLDPELATAASLLAHDVPTFLRESVNVARLEVKKTATDLGVRAGILSASAYFAMVGMFFLFTGLAFAISEALQRAWAGPLIVGAGLVAVAAVAVPVALKTQRVKPAGLHD